MGFWSVSTNPRHDMSQNIVSPSLRFVESTKLESTLRVMSITWSYRTTFGGTNLLRHRSVHHGEVNPRLLKHFPPGHHARDAASSVRSDPRILSKLFPSRTSARAKEYRKKIKLLRSLTRGTSMREQRYRTQCRQNFGTVMVMTRLVTGISNSRSSRA